MINWVDPVHVVCLLFWFSFFIFCGSLPELLFACIFFLYHTFQIHNNDSLIAAVYLFYQIERPFPGEKWSLNKSFSIIVHVTAIFVANYQTSLQSRNRY